MPTSPENPNEERIEGKNELKEEIEMTIYTPTGERKETVKSKSLAEVKELFRRGFTCSWQEEDILTEVDVDVPELIKSGQGERERQYFELNEDRELLYLKSGHDDWMESVNNYWHNYEAYREMEHPSSSMSAQLIKRIKRGINHHAHEEPKKFGSLDIIYRQSLDGIKSTGFSTEEIEAVHERYREHITLPMVNKSKLGGMTPGVFTPKDESIRDTHPLLEPFMDELRKLEFDEVEEIPDWLDEQGIMTGFSAYYQDTYKHLKEYVEALEEQREKYEEFIKEKGIEDAPKFDNTYLIKKLNVLEFVDGKIHRVGE